MTSHEIESGCRPHVQSGNGPGHEELRQREEIREVDAADDLSLHQSRGVADQDRKRKVIDDKEQRCRDNHPELRADEIFELRRSGDLFPWVIVQAPSLETGRS